MPTRIAILDPFSGIAGDMFLGALIDAGLDESFITNLPATLKLDGVTAQVTKVSRGQIACRKVDFTIPPQPHGRHLKHIKAIVEGLTVLVGRAGFLEAAGVDVDPLLGPADDVALDGKTPVFVAIDGRAAAVIAIADTVAEMVRPRSDWPEESRRYGLGFHLHATSDVVWLEGYDAGVSFCSTDDPASGIVATVISNWSDGAWPLVQLLDAWMEEG